MKTPRRATRRVTKVGSKSSRLDRIKHALNPRHIKEYWLSRKGAVMAGKIAGGGFVFLFLLFLFFAKDLPSPSKINSLVGAQTTRFYARDELEKPGQGTLLYEVHGDVNRTVIPFDQMPKTIKQATIAIEDKDFYKHGAFSIFGLGRAFSGVVFRDSSRGGGSTITQQYVKNALLSPERSITRKIKELILAIEIEQLYKKDDILKLYLNEIPYGNQAYGIQAAAKTYFQKDAKDLSLAESALLAAIPNRPTYYNPYGDNREALIARQQKILDLMAEQGYISQDEAEAAKKVDVLALMPSVPATFANVTAPFFVKNVEAQLADKYGSKTVDSGGLKVITTLDPELQKHAEEAIAKNNRNIERNGGSNAALVAADPKTGEVKAYVGGRNFSESQVNVANAERQPGSSFKPFVYATLFSKKTGTTYGAGTTLYDVETDFGGGYKPRNYCLCTNGAVSIRSAIGNSLNIPAVKALYLAGVPESIKMAHEMGITTLNDDPGRYGLSLVLGAGEVKLTDMVNAYSTFAAGGEHTKQRTILKVTNSKNDVLEDNTKKPDTKRVLDAQVAYELNSIMSDASARNITFGANFAPLIVPGKTTAVKTGTTERFRDAWTVGYTQSLVAGVWTGNNDGRSMGGGSGAVAAPVWKDFMVAATKNMPNEPFTPPAGVKQVTIDAITGRAVTDQTKEKRTDVFASWYQPIPATAAQSAKVDKVSGKLATECTPPLAIDTVYSSSIRAEVPPSDPAFGRWDPPVQALAQKLGYQAGASLPTEKDDRHSCSDTKPKVTLTVKDNNDGSVEVKTVVTNGSPFTANKLEVRMDDQIISTKDINGNDTYTFDQTASAGSHTFRATVTDTGYYQGEDSTTVTVAAGTFKNVAPGNGSVQSGNSVNFQWGAKSGAASYSLKYSRNGGPEQTIGGISGTSRTVGSLSPGAYSWRVEASNGGSTATTSFTLI